VTTFLQKKIPLAILGEFYIKKKSGSYNKIFQFCSFLFFFVYEVEKLVAKKKHYPKPTSAPSLEKELRISSVVHKPQLRIL